MIRHRRIEGFTLVEILFVVAIIVILSGIIYASLNSARERARDAQRLEDLAKLKLALEVYFQEYGEFPRESEVGVDNGRIGIGGPMDAYLSDYLNEIPRDPLSGQDNETYFYYFDSSHFCTTNTAPGNAVVYANTMEIEDNANRDDLCDYDEAEPDFAPQSSPGSSAHYIIVSDTGMQ